MMEYIKNIFKDFPKEFTGTKMSPAADHLFAVRDLSLAFHQAMAQLLFLSARAWRDIQPATAFLTMQVRSPDKDDSGKVKRVLSYLRRVLCTCPLSY